MAGQAATYRSLVTCFSDFLTVAIHTILYERTIYPQASFISARKYNFAVRQNRHPKVCEWINDAVAAAEVEILKCSVDRIAVVLHGPDSSVLERFVFDVSRFPVVSSTEIDVTLERSDSVEGQKNVLPLIDLEEQFRASLSQLTTGASRLKPLPPDCSFTVAIELKQDALAPLVHPQPWIPAQREASVEDEAADTTTVPVRTISAGELILETWIERASEE